MSLRVLLTSDAPHSTSGYGVQAGLLGPILRDLGHTVAYLASFGLQGAKSEWHGLPVYPGGLDGFGNDVIGPAARDFQADIVITLKDLWVYRPQEWGPGVRWCVPGYTLVTLADGRKETIEKIVQSRAKVKVKAWDGEKTVAADILDYQCIGASQAGEIVEIETEDGEYLEVTAENQVLILRNGTIEWIDAGCVVPGDVVYCNSSEPYRIEDNDGTTQGNIGESGRPHTRASTNANTDRVGVYGWSCGWRGDDLNPSNASARVVSTPNAVFRGEHQPGIGGLAGRATWHESRCGKQAKHDEPPVVQTTTTGKLYGGDRRVSLLSRPEGTTPLSHREAPASGDRLGVYGEPGNTAVQRPVYDGRNPFVAPSAGFEPQVVRYARRRGRPYSLVYDITTAVGSFVAGNILIHNCPLVPADHDPLPQGILQILRSGPLLLPIAYSAFGQQQLHDAGFVAPFAPHAYDSRVLFPEDRAAARAALGLADDLFIVGMVAVNRGGIPSRKAWPQNLEGFALFAREHPEARLLCHTYDGREGHEQAINLPALADQLGITDKVLFVDQTAYKAGLPVEYMRRFYSTIDVLNAVSLGEGFGVPTLEAQACGTPVLIGDWCSSAELLFAGAALPPEDALRFYDGQGSYVFIPHPRAIGGALHVLKERLATERAALRERALAGAARYEVARVREDWRSAMTAIERAAREPRAGVLRIVHPASVICDASDSWAADAGGIRTTADAYHMPDRTVPA